MDHLLVYKLVDNLIEGPAITKYSSAVNNPILPAKTRGLINYLIKTTRALFEGCLKITFLFTLCVLVMFTDVDYGY